MAHEITYWKTRTLKHFALPLSALYWETGAGIIPAHAPCPRPIIEGITRGTFIHIDGKGLCLRGKLRPGLDMMDISEITLSGEASRAMLFEVLFPAFEKSDGLLKAILVWDAGENIERLTVDAGRIDRQGVDL